MSPALPAADQVLTFDTRVLRVYFNDQHPDLARIINHWLEAENEPWLVLSDKRRPLEPAIVSTMLEIAADATDTAAVTLTADGPATESQPVLAPDFRAALLSRSALVAADGVDVHLLGWGDHLDLGWRWWRLGYRVLALPTAEALPPRVSSHTHDGESFGIGWRNWLRLLVKLGDEHHWATQLSCELQHLLNTAYTENAALIETHPPPPPTPETFWQKLRRLLRRPDPPAGLFIAPNDPSVPLATVPRPMLTALVTAHDLVEAMPFLLEQRQVALEQVERSQTEIARLLGRDPLEITRAWFLAPGETAC